MIQIRIETRNIDQLIGPSLQFPEQELLLEVWYVIYMKGCHIAHFTITPPHKHTRLLVTCKLNNSPTEVDTFSIQ